MEQRDPMSTLKQLSCRKYSFQNLKPFSQGNNMLDAAASNTNGLFWRNSCVSSNLVNAYLEEKETTPP
jgi:hypothetical protein